MIIVVGATFATQQASWPAPAMISMFEYPHSHGLRRTYPQPVDLSAEDQTALNAAQAEFNSLTEQFESAEELPDEIDARFGELEAEIERLEAKRLAYDPAVNDDSGAGPNGEAGGGALGAEDEDVDDQKSLSDILIRDLTAHRTLGLRLALGEQPEVAVVAVTHALSAQIFYRGADAHVLDIRPVSTVLASHADGIEDTKAGRPRRITTLVGRRRCRAT
jgi:ParB family chromosome partitioning protein